MSGITADSSKTKESGRKNFVEVTYGFGSGRRASWVRQDWDSNGEQSPLVAGGHIGALGHPSRSRCQNPRFLQSCGNLNIGMDRAGWETCKKNGREDLILLH